MMNERIRELAKQAGFDCPPDGNVYHPDIGDGVMLDGYLEKFAELIVAECVNREALLGAIARGWCSEKNSHKTMDSDLAVAIYDEVEQQIRQQFGVENKENT
jgi:hypothetical protein